MMYELWMSQGQGEAKVAEFETLEQTLVKYYEVKGQGAFAIKYPDGQWHKWNDQTS
jgi:hypothetical protein